MDKVGDGGVAVAEGVEMLIGADDGLGHISEGGEKEHDGVEMPKHGADVQDFHFCFQLCGEQISKMLLLARSEYYCTQRKSIWIISI